MDLASAGENVVATIGSDNVTTDDVQRQVARIMQGQANLPKGILAMYIPRIVDQLVETEGNGL